MTLWGDRNTEITVDTALGGEVKEERRTKGGRKGDTKGKRS